MNQESPRGRPAKDIDRAVADAVIERISAGGNDLSVEAIARRVGVHRSTIYRRWPGRSALVELAAARVAEQLAPGPAAEDISARDLLDAACGLLGTAAGRRLVVARASTSGMPTEPATGGVAGVPPTILHDIIVGAVIHRTLIVGSPTTEEWKRNLLSSIGSAAP